jgi:small-conductance mechanosensitive channel
MPSAVRQLAETWIDRAGAAVPWAPVRIVAIVVVALVVRWFAFRAIRAFVTRAVRFSPHPRLAGSRSGRMLLDSAGLLDQRRQQRVQTLGSTLRSLTSFTVAIVAGLMVLSELGVNIGPALASAGILAAAIAFGAQQIVRDFLTGAFLLVEDQYGVGDSIDTGTVAGTVEAVGLRITQIRDDQGVVWYVRNGEILRVGNRSQGWGVAVVDVPVGYAVDLAAVRALLETVGADMRQHPEWGADLLADPEVTGPESLTPDSVVLRLSVRTPPGEKIAVERELRTRILTGFTEQGLRVSAATPAPPAPG